MKVSPKSPMSPSECSPAPMRSGRRGEGETDGIEVRTAGAEKFRIEEEENRGLLLYVRRKIEC